jgi:hypothetical protein
MFATHNEDAEVCGALFFSGKAASLCGIAY